MGRVSARWLVIKHPISTAAGDLLSRDHHSNSLQNLLALHCNLAKACALGLGGGLCPLVLLLRHSASPAPSVAAVNTAGCHQGLVAAFALITHTAAAHYISPWADDDGATPALSLIHIISPQWEKLKDHKGNK